MGRARRQTPKRPAGGIPRRDRGKRPDSYRPQGAVSWPTMADGTEWTADMKGALVQEVDRLPEEWAPLGQPELVEGAWSVVLEWPLSGSRRVRLDMLLP